MKTYKLFLSALIALCIAVSAQAQGGFGNLDFESASLAPVPVGQFGGEVSIVHALPMWTVYLDTVQQTQVMQNNMTFGNASVDILGPNWNLGGIIEGQYTVVLEPGRGPNSGGPPSNVSASISQTDVVPVGAQSLQFKAEISTPFSVSLGGQNLDLVQLGTGANYTLYGANLPLSEIGQSEALTITALAGPNNPDYFDSFVFSPSAVPEPGTLGLLAVSGALFGLFRRRV